MTNDLKPRRFRHILCAGIALAALSACQTTGPDYYTTDPSYYSSARQAAAGRAAAASSEDLAILDYYRERIRLALGKREQVKAAKIATISRESEEETAPPVALPPGWRPMRF